jgi:hypothetical protein
MKLNTARAKQIDAYIDANPDQKIADAKDQKSFTHIKGQLTWLNVYRLPIDLLVYNIMNGRFRGELIAKQEELKRKLDPTDKRDAKIIQQLLFDQSISETEALKDDLKKDGQLVPGIITFDGAVINANRRMSILSKLFAETGERQYQYLKVGRLQQGVDETDLWNIEAEFQFGRDYKVDYGGVNELLKIKDGLNRGMSEKQISVALRGRFSEKEVKDKLEILRLLESYLYFIEKPLDYHNSVQELGHLEKFISLHSALKSMQKAKKLREAAAITLYAFASILKTDIRHLEYRKLKDISANPNAYLELMKGFNPKKPNSASREKLVDSFDTAIEIVKNNKESDRPIQLLKKALTAIGSIDGTNKKLKDPNIIEILNELAKRVSNLQKIVKGRK